MEGKDTFTVIDDQGKELKCEVLFTFDLDETGKHYIIYTDNTTDEEGNTMVYASTYELGEGKTILGEIETEKEWEFIEKVIDCLQDNEG